MSGAFAAEALHLRSLGLVPIPCNGDEDDDGKTPGLKTANWKRLPGQRAYHQWVLRFGERNIGLLTGPSGLVIIDNDDPRISASEIEYRFGVTPLITRTPGRHTHHYYRNSGERNRNLRRVEGIAVDVRGIGGFAVCPPSVRPSGPNAGTPYEIAQGRWEDVLDLPRLKPGSLSAKPVERPRARLDHPIPIMDAGTRHVALFDHARRFAREAPDFDTCLVNTHWANQQCRPDILSDADVLNIAQWAWKYQQEGRNFPEGTKVLLTTEPEYLALTPYGSDAVVLYMRLRADHFARPSFAVSPKAMARAEAIPGWTVADRYRNARDTLIKAGFLVVVRRGGRGPGDPGLFSFDETATTGPFSLRG